MPTVARLVAILEDDADRVAAMRACLSAVLPGVDAVFFEDAREMITWLRHHLSEVELLSLDHDLPLRGRGGATIDCGTGRQVVDYLASLPPTCPVIVHSSNDACAAGMFFALNDAGWTCSRVYPHDGEAWVRETWSERVRRHLTDR